MPMFITNQYTRSELLSKGINPDTPGLADTLLKQGYSDWDIGKQPSTGLSGMASAILRGAARNVGNSAIGLADLVPGVNISPIEPSPVEQAHPIASGIGQTAGFIGSLALGEGAVGLAGKLGALGKLGSASELVGLLEESRLAQHGVTLGRAAQNLMATELEAQGLAGIGGRLGLTESASLGLAKSRLGASSVLSEAGRLFNQWKAPETLAERIFSGVAPGTLGPTVARTSALFSGINFIQPGSIEDRMQNAMRGAWEGAAFGLFAPVPGVGRLAGAIRGLPAAMLSPAPFDIPGVPSPITNALIQAGFGALQGGKLALGETPEPGLADPNRSSTPPGRMPQRSDIPEELLGSHRDLFTKLAANPGAIKRDVIAKYFQDHYYELDPATQAAFKEYLLTVNSASSPGFPPATPHPDFETTSMMAGPADHIASSPWPGNPEPSSTTPKTTIFESQPSLPGMSGARPATISDPIPRAPEGITIISGDPRNIIFRAPSLTDAQSSDISQSIAGEFRGKRVEHHLIATSQGPVIIKSNEVTPSEYYNSISNVTQSADAINPMLWRFANKFFGVDRTILTISEGTTETTTGPNFVHINLFSGHVSSPKSLISALTHEISHFITHASLQIPDANFKFWRSIGADIKPSTPETVYGQRLIANKYGKIIGVKHDFRIPSTQGDLVGTIKSYNPTILNILTSNEGNLGLERLYRKAAYDPELFQALRSAYIFKDPIHEFPAVIVEQFFHDPDYFFRTQPRLAAGMANYLAEVSGMHPVDFFQMVKAEDPGKVRAPEWQPPLPLTDYTGLSPDLVEFPAPPAGALPPGEYTHASTMLPRQWRKPIPEGRQRAILANTDLPSDPQEWAFYLDRFREIHQSHFAAPNLDKAERITYQYPNSNRTIELVKLRSRVGAFGPEYDLYIPADRLAELQQGKPLAREEVLFKVNLKTSTISKIPYQDYVGAQWLQTENALKARIAERYKGRNVDAIYDVLHSLLLSRQNKPTHFQRYLDRLWNEPLGDHAFNVKNRGYDRYIDIAADMASGSSTYDTIITDPSTGQTRPKDPWEIAPASGRLLAQPSTIVAEAIQTLRRIIARSPNIQDPQEILRLAREGVPASGGDTAINPIDPSIPDVPTPGTVSTIELLQGIYRSNVSFQEKLPKKDLENLSANERELYEQTAAADKQSKAQFDPGLEAIKELPDYGPTQEAMLLGKESGDDFIRDTIQEHELVNRSLDALPTFEPSKPTGPGLSPKARISEILPYIDNPSIEEAETQAARLGTSTAAIDAAFKVAKEMGPSANTTAIAQRLQARGMLPSDLSFPPTWSWNAARIVMNQLTDLPSKPTLPTLGNWIAKRVIKEVNRLPDPSVKDQRFWQLERKRISEGPYLEAMIPALSKEDATMLFRIPLDMKNLGDRILKVLNRTIGRTEPARLEAETLKAANLRDSLEATQANLLKTVQRDAAKQTKRYDIESRSIEAKTRTLKELTDRLAKYHEEGLDPKASPKERARSVRNLQKVSTDIAGLTKSIESLKRLKDRTAATNLGVPQDPDLARAMTLAADLHLRASNLLDAIEQAKNLAPQAIFGIDVEQARKAMTLFGSPQMPDVLYNNLPPSLQIIHTVHALTHPELTVAHPKVRLRILAQFFNAEPRSKGHPLQRPLQHPYAHALVEAYQGGRANSISALRSAITKRAETGRLPDFNLDQTPTYPAPYRRIEITDRVTNKRYSFTSEEAASLGLDLLDSQRRNAPNLTPPLTDFQFHNFAGPNSPENLPTGILHDEEASGAPIPTPSGDEWSPPGSTLNKPSKPYQPNRYGNQKPISLGFYARHINVAQTVIPKIERLWKQATNQDLGLSSLFRAALDGYTKLRSEMGAFDDKLLKLYNHWKLDTGYILDAKLGGAMREYDNRAYAIQKVDGPEAARAALPTIREEIRLQHNLTSAEHAFLFGNSHSSDPLLSRGVEGMIQDHYQTYLREMGAPEEVIGFFPRVQYYSRGISTATPGAVQGIMRKDFMDIRTLHTRQRSRALETEDRGDSIRNQTLAEIMGSNVESFRGSLLPWARSVVRTYHLGNPISDLQNLISNTDGTIKGSNSGAYLDTTVQQYLFKEIDRFMQIPSTSDIAHRSAIAARNYRFASKMLNHLETLDKSYLPEPVVSGLQNFFKSMSIKTTTGESLGILDAFVKANRSAIFSFHIMRAVRDAVTTDALFLFPRFGPRTFGTVMTKLLTDREYRSNLAREAFADGMLHNEDIVRMEAENRFGNKMVEWFKDKGSWMYRKQDTHTRLASYGMSKESVSRALADYQKNHSFEDFLATTALDTHPKEIFDDQTRAQIKGYLDTGNSVELTRIVAGVHDAGTVFNYLRPNAPPFYDNVFGRLFGQYGTWPINTVNSLYHLYRSPFEHHTGARALARAVQSATYYAVAAEAVYSLGAAFNIDTSSWIPFVNNFLYGGGPALSLVEKTRDLIMDRDPEAAAQLAKNPGKTLASLLAQAVPIPASDTLKRAISGVFGSDESTQRFFGFPDDQADLWDRALVIGGFTPLQGLYPHRRKAIKPISSTLTAAPRAAQDILSEATPLPPGSREPLKSWKPLVGQGD